MKNISFNSILDRLLDPVTRSFTPEVAQALIDLQLDAKAQKRIDDLADKCTEGILTPGERTEYELYVQAIDFIGVFQSKARTFLGHKAAI